jgi:TRAP-type C4-dicarboxylate transport system permease small subunit
MMLEKVDNVFLKLEKVQIHCSWVMTMFVTFMLVTDILARFLFNKPLPASWEISEVLMPYIVIIGFAYTLTKDKHILVSIMTDLLPVKIRTGLKVFAYLISFLMCCLITYFSWLWFWESFLINEQILAPINIPWWVGKLVMPFTFATFGIRYLLISIISLLRTHSDSSGRK